MDRRNIADQAHFVDGAFQRSITDMEFKGRSKGWIGNKLKRTNPATFLASHISSQNLVYPIGISGDSFLLLPLLPAFPIPWPCLGLPAVCHIDVGVGMLPGVVEVSLGLLAQLPDTLGRPAEVLGEEAE